MYTQCPNCKTLFRVRQAQLDSARGKVRCGECMVVFNANDDLRGDSRQPVAPPQKTAGRAPTRPKPAPSPAAGPKRGPRAAAPAPAAVSKAPSGEVPEELLPFLALPVRRQAGAGWIILIAVLFAVLVGQYLWFNRTTLVANPALRPMAENVCKFADCELAPPQNPSAFKLTDLGVQTHPEYQGALLVDATFINNSSKPLSHPNLELVFTDPEGARVASRRFSPVEYLGKKPQQLLAPGEETHVVLELLDPGDLAVGYEFKFF